ncbi:hypothetical protein [Amycolatopsis minnesotensis]
MARQRNPLEPLTGIARISSWFVYVFALLGIMLVLFGPGGLVSGPGLRTTCVDSAGSLSVTGGTGFPLKPGARLSGASAEACLDHASTGVWLSGFADRWIWYLWAAGALALLLRFLRGAALKGPYDQAVPGRLAALGWYLPVAAAVVAAVAATARSTLLGAAFESPASWTSLWAGAFPLWSAFAGAAALTFARILRIGVRMHEDLEGTV